MYLTHQSFVMMKKLKNLYVAATSQHVGKTTSTLGLAASFKKAGINVGYCKPVGQMHVEIGDSVVDKDAVLFADLLKLDITPNIHSPVIIGKGATAKFLDNPTAVDLNERIVYARQELEKTHEAIIYEGTGHPGVGSVANVSNAQVAKLLDAQVVMVVEGGIGSTIDKLNMSLALFREYDVPIMGVIVNKVIPSKMLVIEKYIKLWLDQNDLRLLGVVPYDNTLGYPLVWTIAKTINGVIEHHNEKGFNKVEQILAGSLVDADQLKKSGDNLLVVSSRVLDVAISRIEEISLAEEFEDSPLCGVVITGEEPISKPTLDYLKKYSLPTIRTELDTYGAVIKISKLEVKINRRTPWKISKAIELINDHVDIEAMIKLLQN